MIRRLSDAMRSVRRLLRGREFPCKDIPSTCPRCGAEMIRLPSVATESTAPDIVVIGFSLKPLDREGEVCLSCNYNCR